MKRVLTGLAAVLAGVLAAAAWAAAADDKKDAKGWVQLFDGKDLIGWKIHGQPNPRDIVRIYPKIEGGKPVAYEGQLKKSDKVVPLWRVEDGILIGSGPSTHLFSDRGDYENFYFRVEVMINDHGNSGQYFRTKFGPAFPRVTKPRSTPRTVTRSAPAACTLRSTRRRRTARKSSSTTSWSNRTSGTLRK
jgi:hypothetical protein